MSKPASRAEAALDELCVRYGYCLPGEQKKQELLAAAPDDADSFLDAVLSAEEARDSTLIDELERDLLLAVISDWLFDNGRGRGTRSGLPRYPAAPDPSP